MSCNGNKTLEEKIDNMLGASGEKIYSTVEGNFTGSGNKELFVLSTSKDLDNEKEYVEISRVDIFVVGTNDRIIRRIKYDKYLAIDLNQNKEKIKMNHGKEFKNGYVFDLNKNGLEEVFVCSENCVYWFEFDGLKIAGNTPLLGQGAKNIQVNPDNSEIIYSLGYRTGICGSPYYLDKSRIIWDCRERTYQKELINQSIDYTPYECPECHKWITFEE